MDFSLPVPQSPIAPSSVAGDPPQTAAVEPRTDSSRPSFAEVFRTVAARIDAGEKLLAQVERARGTLDATQLLVLQAGVYRYSEAVELAAKLVDRVGNAIKTTLQSQ